MANTANTQQNKGHDTVKNVKSVLLTTRELQQSLAEVKKQAVALSDLIQKRKTEFLRKEAESLAEIQATENIIVCQLFNFQFIGQPSINGWLPVLDILTSSLTKRPSATRI